jgi:nucleoid-associated protein YgaU
MSRRFTLILAAFVSVAGYNPTQGQDMQPASASPSSAAVDASAPASDNIATLKAQNAELQKEVSDAKQTISELQAKLAQTGSGGQPSATTDTAAPAGPQKALPLDATNVVTTPGVPGAAASDAGPSKTYTVVKGDSLWKIAHKMYPGDTKNGVDKLQEANKDAIGGKPLKIGQVLVVPQ